MQRKRQLARIMPRVESRLLLLDAVLLRRIAPCRKRAREPSRSDDLDCFGAQYGAPLDLSHVPARERHGIVDHDDEVLLATGVDWFTKTAFLEATMRDLPNPLARLGGNVQATGRRGGHDLHYRTLHARSVMLVGRFAGCQDGIAYFAHDLEESVAFGDARYGDVCGLIRKTCIEKGIDVPDMPPPSPFTSSAPTALDVRRFGAVIFTSGYRPAYASWIHVAVGFDELGYPIQRDGSSTVVPGLHFMGVHFQRKRKSATCSASQRMPPSSPSASGSNAEQPPRRVSGLRGKGPVRLGALSESN